MRSRLRLLAAVQALFLLGALGCGDEEGGGCGPAPEKKSEEPAAPSAAGRAAGGSGAAPELKTTEGRRSVPKAYQRPESGTRDGDAGKSDRGISKPKIAKSTEAAAAAAPASMPLKPPPVKVLRRKVDGVADRVEISCRMLASDPGPECAASSNYLEIKLRCCPDGAVERCRPTKDGVVIVGRGCEPAAP